MSVHQMNTLKLLILNEDKSRGVTVEYPMDMKMGELLDKLNELTKEVKAAHLKQLEGEKEEKDAKESKDKEEKVIEIPKEEVKDEKK